MPNWKKVIVSGSHAHIVAVTASSQITVNPVAANTEAALVLGPPPAGGSGEGGQLALQPASGFTSGSFIDNYQTGTTPFIRLLRGTAAASDALVAQWNLHTKQMHLPAYTAVGVFSGTAVAALGVTSGGDVIAIATASGGGGGSGTVNGGAAGFLAYYPSAGTTVDDASGVSWDSLNSRLAVTGSVIATANGAMYFRGGDDAEFWDINVANTVGIYGQQDSTIGSIKLGSGGGVISGKSGNIGIGTTNPTSASLTVDSNVWAKSFTGSLQGLATSASKADNISTTTTSANANYVLTFVDSDNATPDYEKLWTSNGATFNPSTGVLRTPTMVATQGVTGSLFGTASWATRALTASYVAGYAQGSGVAEQVTFWKDSSTVSGSTWLKITSSIDGLGTKALQLSGSYYSYADTATSGNGFVAISASSTVFGMNAAQNEGQLYAADGGTVKGAFRISKLYTNGYSIGSAITPGANNTLRISPTVVMDSGLSGSLFGTASWAARAVTASYANNAGGASLSDAVYVNLGSADVDILTVSSTPPGYTTPEIDQYGQLKWAVSNPIMTAIQVRPNGLGQNVFFGALTNAGEGLIEATQGRIYYYSDRHIFGTNAYGYSGQFDPLGNFDAANDITCGGTKFFDIPHQSKEGWGLKHAAIEGPESAVFHRGKLDGSDTIELPEYWQWLVHEDTITVSLTPVGQYQALYVKDISNSTITIGSDGDYVKCHYTIYAERKDVERWDVEYEGYTRLDK